MFPKFSLNQFGIVQQLPQRDIAVISRLLFPQIHFVADHKRYIIFHMDEQYFFQRIERDFFRICVMRIV